jgi:sugar lactone lactonase YvrE
MAKQFLPRTLSELLLLVVSVPSLLTGCRLYAQGTYTISTLSGANSTLDGYSGDGGPATKARLNRPSGLAIGPRNVLYISDRWNQVIRAIDSSGRISTVAGNGAQGFGGDGGPARGAKLLFPRGLAFDSDGNLYIADSGNNRIRRVGQDGIIETFAGTGERGYSGNGGPAIEAKLSWPDGLAFDRNGVLYFSENLNNTIRKIKPDGVIDKVVGTPGHRGALDSPRAIAFDASVALYVADRDNQRVSRINADSTAVTVAGDGVNRGMPGTGDGGPAITASIPYPLALAFDPDGNLIIASDRIRRVDKSGIVTTLIGTGPVNLAKEDDDPLHAQLGSPSDLVYDTDGALYVADTYRNRVLRLDGSGKLSVAAGLGSVPDEIEGGRAELAHHDLPLGLAVSSTGDLLVADTGMNRICRMTPEGRFYTVAGKGRPIIRMEGGGPPPQFTGDGGPAKSADLDMPSGVAVDAKGSIYISDSYNNRVRKVDLNGIIRTIAGTGQDGFGGDGGPATAAKLSHPMGVAVDSQGNVYIADRQNNRIRRVTPDGRIDTVIGSGKKGDSGAGPALSIKLNFPHGVAVDRQDNIYVADTFNHRVRKLGRDGIVRNIAGTGEQEFVGDGGPAVKAGLAAPDAIAVDAQGNIYIADRANWRIRKITTDGIIHTIAGNHETGYSGDGGPALEAPIFPTGVAVDNRGAVYVTHGDRIRVLTPEQPR